MLLATMLTELAAGVFETAAAVFHTPDHIAAALTQAAESSEDNPSDNPDDACRHRIPRMLPAAALCPGTETVTASTRPPYGPAESHRHADHPEIHTGRTACRTFCIYRI